MRYNHLWTPVGLNRGPGQTTGVDPDPRYQNMTSDALPSTLAHLDEGVLSHFYTTLYPNHSGWAAGTPEVCRRPPYTTLAGAMYPLTATDLGPGLVAGHERVVTRRSGKLVFPAARRLCVRLFRDGVFASERREAGNVTLALAANEVAIVELGQSGCLQQCQHPR